MRRTLLAFALVSTLAAPVLAGELAGVMLPDTAKAGDKDLVLNGLGLRKKLFIKIYVGGLYLTAKEHDAAKVLAADSPRRMVMHFLYGVSASQMCDAWDEGLEQNTPNPSADVKAAFKTLCSYMEEIPKGNELVLTYVPGQGTLVEVNGKAKGTLAGKDVADATLATWIGPDPAPGTDFKNAVLGQ
ncbi:MAG: chalcone isomerase family protein [Acidobacteriota bacterium]